MALPFFFLPKNKNKKHREDASSCSCDIIYGCHIRHWKLGGGGEEEEETQINDRCFSKLIIVLCIPISSLSLCLLCPSSMGQWRTHFNLFLYSLSSLLIKHFLYEENKITSRWAQSLLCSLVLIILPCLEY